MASLTSACPTFSSSSFTSSSPLPHAKPSQLLNAKRNQRFVVKATSGSDGTSKSADTSLGKLDRRNVLLGLGGLYGAADMVGHRLALADTAETGGPIPYPDLSQCATAYKDPGRTKPVEYSCCPPSATEVKPYVIPVTPVKRVRPAAHLVDDQYMEKYIKAIQAMRDLPNDDPLSFYQQANIHCAYCNYGHRIGTDDDGNVLYDRVHGSWFFAPFHRWYLYFFEKAAGKLIDDPTFALPYWNWDAPCGMTMPYMFAPEKSPLDPSKPNSLYDVNRKPACQPPAVIDLGSSPAGTPDIQKVCNNLAVVYRSMVTNAQDEISFFGSEYFYGVDSPASPGTLELVHNPAHGWVGGDRANPATLNGEDMGNFYSSGKDPIFYCHHANVDRLWNVWLSLGNKQIKNTSWLNSQFFFWDENRNPVYVTVKDSLNIDKLGYTYQPMELPWLKAKPMPRVTKNDVAKKSTAPSVANAFPATLNKVVKVLVQRPQKSRSKDRKKKKRETLVIEGIEYPGDRPVKFDVFINDEDDKGFVLSKAEYAGSFVTVPHGGGGHGGGKKESSKLKIGLGEILEDLQADDDEFILVTLIPKSECEDVTIEYIRIDYL